MKLVYKNEIGLSYSDWANSALPIGNGNLGAKVFGGVKKDRLQTNIISLWSGGPQSFSDENIGGNIEDSYKYVKESRRLLENGNYDEARIIAENHLVGPNNREYGNYLPLSDVFFNFENVGENYTDYSRVLDLNNAISTIKFKEGDCTYTREFFVSYPHDAIVAKFEVEGNKTLNFSVEVESTEDFAVEPTSDDSQTIKLEGDKTSKISEVIADASNQSILLSGKVRDNNREFSSLLQVIELEGLNAKVEVKNNKLIIKDAAKVVIAISSETDFEQNFPHYRKENYDTTEVVQRKIKNLELSYDNLLEAHLNDYQNLYKRVELNIGEMPDNYDTAKMLKDYKNGIKDNYLDTLLFQYGRYLLIASSRDSVNSLPANLQGVWCANVNPAWNSDYHMNVNLQMNYWPAYVTNLIETSYPLINYIDDMRQSGRIAAEYYGGIKSESHEENGWLAHTQNTPYGWTTPGWSYYWGWSPAANAWIMQNVFEHYEFSGDVDYLNNKIYPMLKETVKFWNSFLHFDKNSDRYVSTPSYSPEHGPISIGNTFDQSLVAQLFIDFLIAYEKLSDTDSKLKEEVEYKLTKLNPLIIGEQGQIKEWYEEGMYNHYLNGERIPETEDEHRHISQLVGLYPGKLFQSMETINAAKETLNLRGDGGSGWAKSNKVCLWARLFDGNRAHKLVGELFEDHISDNIWNSGPPFQADGNYGVTAGIAEMLIQSHSEYLKPLPALPDAWSEGSVKGLVARGNFEVDIIWKEKLITELTISSRKKNPVCIEYPNIGQYDIFVNDNKIKNNEQDLNTVSFDLDVNDVIVFRSNR